MKNLLNKIKIPIKLEFTGTIGQCFLLAVVLNFFVEIMSRHSIWKACLYFFTSPLVFLYNALIIMITLSIALLFKKRIFALFIISIIWILVGIVDFILLFFRTTPFTAVDILLLKSVVAIIPHYLDYYHYILIGLALILMIALSIWMFKKSPKIKISIRYIKTTTFILATILSTLGLTHVGVWAGLLSENFGNLAGAFHDYGLPYCFVNSVLNTGIKKPKQYSTNVVSQILDSIDKGILINASDITPTITVKENSPTPRPTITPIPTKMPIEEIVIPNVKASKETPNIIMLQLESFFDPTKIIGAKFTKDPLPTFRYLKENFTSGFLSVPSVGAGTANTEFEIITGMNLDFFGPGEYPYKTVLQSTTCESVNFNLKPLGYQTHAIHNNIATFYDRHIVFSQLGFDTFTSLEYMEEPELTPLNWAKDNILTNEIQKALESTTSPDFVYAISVQGHGAYPTTPLLENKEIDLILPEKFSLEDYYSFLYYVNQIYEMDIFLHELISYLEQCGEETILVLYGDHLPGLSFDAEDLTNNSLFETEYVMWSNFDLEIEQVDLEAYQLYSYVFERLNISEGLIPKLHQTQKNSDIYIEQLRILEYDMLYGDLECFGGVNPFSPTNLQMGIYELSFYSYHVSEVEGKKDTYNLHIVGNHFNKYSKICINDTPISITDYQSKNLLSALDIELKSGDKITISQVGDDSRVLSVSKEKYFRK